MTDIVSRAALQALGAGEELRLYAAALEHACESGPPYGVAWFGREFRRLADDPSWFASLLVSDVDLEGYSASQLWSYADGVADPAFAVGLRVHAADEARHSRMFASLLFTLFPRLETPELRDRLKGLAPPLAPAGVAAPAPGGPLDEEQLNSAILINLHEVKALMLERLLRPALLDYAPEPQRARVAAVADRLIADEINHIRYSAAFIQSAAAAGRHDEVMDAMADFQETLNAVTLHEVERPEEVLGYTGDLVEAVQP